MRNALVFLVLALAVAAAAVAASIVLLGSTGGDARVGNLSPVLGSGTVPATPRSVPTQVRDDHHGGRESDD